MTGFDIVGVPVWQAVRPASRSLSVSQGKGATACSARIGAIMEAAELWHAERLPAGEVRAALADEAALWTRHLIGPGDGALSGELNWLDGCDLLSGRAIAVPRSFLSLDYTEPDAGAFAPNSTGLTAGNTIAEATLAALSEIAERRFLHAFFSASARERIARRIDPASVTGRRPRWAIKRFARAGLAFVIWNLSEDDDVACFAVCILGGAGPFPVRPVTGAAAHPMAERAILGALLEAAQVRVTLLAGARDDLKFSDYARDWSHAAEMAASIGLMAAGEASGSPFRSSANPPSSIEAATDRMVALFNRWSAPALVRVEHTIPEIGIPVVKLLAPGCQDAERRRI